MTDVTKSIDHVFWEWDNEGTWVKYDEKTIEILENCLKDDNSTSVTLTHDFYSNRLSRDVRRTPPIEESILSIKRETKSIYQETRLRNLLHEPQFPHSLDEIEIISTLNGSSAPKKVKWTPEGGEKELFFVLKEGHEGNNEQCRAEFQVNEAYYAAGAEVPRFKLFEEEGKVKILGTWIDGPIWKNYQESCGKSLSEIESIKAKLRQFFIIDCLLGNWDVLGNGEDNVIVDEIGVPWRVDNGGCLSFRAKGEKKKPHEWSDSVSEINTLKYGNEITAKVFAGLSIEGMQWQVYNLITNDEKKNKILDCIEGNDKEIVRKRIVWLSNWLERQDFDPSTIGSSPSLTSSSEEGRARGSSSSSSSSSHINEENIITLVAMGFDRSFAIDALQKTDNNIEKAVAMLSSTEADKSTGVDTSLLAQIIAMGFPEEVAKEALTTKNNNLNEALDMLMG